MPSSWETYWIEGNIRGAVQVEVCFLELAEGHEVDLRKALVGEEVSLDLYGILKDFDLNLSRCQLFSSKFRSSFL